MKTSLLIHLVRKDFSAFRVHLILLWLIIVAAVVMPLGTTMSAMSASSAIVTAFFLLLFLIQALLFQLDPATGTDNFLTTRPIPKSTLLGSKLALFFAAGIAPLLIAAVLQAARAWLDLTAGGYLWICVKLLLIYGGVAGLTALIAAYTPNIPRFIAYIVGISMLILIVFKPSLNPWVNTIWEKPTTGSLLKTRACLSLLCCGIAGYTLVALRYFHVRWKFHVAIAALGAVIAILCAKYWPVDLIPSRKQHVIPSTQVADTIGKIEIDFKLSAAAHGSSTINGRTFSILGAPLTVSNLPDQYFLQNTGYRSVGVLREGGKVPSAYTPRSYASAHPPLGKIRALLNIPSTQSDDGSVFMSDILTYEPYKIHTRYGIGSLSGECNYDLYEPSIVAELPLKPGSSFTTSGARIEFVDVRQGSGSLALKIKITSIADLSGVSYSSHAMTLDNHTFYIANAVRKQLLVGNGGGGGESGSVNFAGIRISHYDQNMALRDEKFKDIAITPEWLNEARIYVVHSKLVGSFSRPFEFRNVEFINTGKK